jgi:hypothetical protein
MGHKLQMANTHYYLKHTLKTIDVVIISYDEQELSMKISPVLPN